MSTRTEMVENSSAFDGAETSAGLRHRLTRKSYSQSSTEELLVEKLDHFLSSIESRLDNFEQFFKFRSDEFTEKTTSSASLDVGYSRSRSNSSASLSSIKSFSVNYLNQIHQRLNVIKDSVLQTSITNLDYLYNTLDDQYNYLFNSSLSDLDHEVTETTTTQKEESHKEELLSQKIITTIQYFDEKLLQIDDFIKDNKPAAKEDYDQDAAFNHLSYFNFNKALKNAEHSYLHYYELPLSWRENKYIIQGYRFSLKHSTMLRSIFHFNHNETMNIWTHLLGFFALLYLLLVHYPSTQVYAQNTTRDNLAIYGFFAAAMNCLVSSVVWHTYSCFANFTTRSRCACVDYTGITVLITFSVISAEYCSLYKHPMLLNFYVLFSALCGSTGFLFNWSPYFDKPECRSLRIGFFMGLAFMGVTTSFCMWFYEGFVVTIMFFLPMVYKSFVWYWLGVVFYGGLIPERWRYDVIIDDEHNCHGDYSTKDVIMDRVDRSGEEEKEEIEHELEEETANDEDKLKAIIKKHFPDKPTMTPYYRDFFSLWWVDYFLSSHNIWHMCVVGGIVGHYFSILDMYETMRTL
ncbi:HlyIII-domain-containing protein [Suhomyces tanzawaensis NRRL Y-17324]|uniref:HlyIII-domain-containing protein n=1 Tax=Suhomyces tanzawaensis NRRL Y-17324 TaxID=984487 RepID=A0A1E4SCT1_9ASCO|nr:HlyIII-domain-containing protein [Suhomyces tanzawaensis NRRL Y-17324]ODV77324.1 HlyIII-domain-containing protein [Suhomyces tanzawaensis NRRL Y-17324]